MVYGSCVWPVSLRDELSKLGFAVNIYNYNFIKYNFYVYFVNLLK